MVEQRPPPRDSKEGKGAMPPMQPTIVVPGSGFTEEDAAEARQVLREGMRATTTARRRSLEGQMQYVEVPDFPTRAIYAKIVLEHSRGKPTTVTLHANLGNAQGAETEKTLIARVLEDPVEGRELLAMAQKVLDAAKSSLPVDVEARQALPEGQSQPPESQSGGSTR